MDQNPSYGQPVRPQQMNDHQNTNVGDTTMETEDSEYNAETLKEKFQQISLADSVPATASNNDQVLSTASCQQQDSNPTPIMEDIETDPPEPFENPYNMS
ncbi:hypothetical protein B5X24_HaOG211886 [Helicoverpa armigera]|nr:hypothetical protein B5X24_HaOG211886 [Helicoverpa armigera]